MSSMTQDKNGDLHLHLDPEDVPSNVPATKEEKQEIYDEMGEFMGEFMGGMTDILVAMGDD